MNTQVAVIGVGMMGSDHVRRLATKIAGAEVGAIVDADESRAQALKEELTCAPRAKNAWVCTDPKAAIADEQTQAAIIATHDASHEELVTACLERGIPVMCEKPLAPTEEECQRLVERETEIVTAGGNRLISVGFMRRFDPGCVQLKQAVDTNAYGSPLINHCLHRNVNPYPGGSDHTITGSAVHEFDFIPWLMGENISEVAWLGSASSSRTTRRDPQLLLIRTADGVLTTLEMFVSATYGYEVGCEVVFERGTLSLSEPNCLIKRDGLSVGYDLPADSIPRYSTAYDIEIQAWIDSINAKGDPDPRLASAWDGLLATRSANKMVEAMQAGNGTFIQVETPPTPEIYR